MEEEDLYTITISNLTKEQRDQLDALIQPVFEQIMEEFWQEYLDRLIAFCNMPCW